MYPHVRRPSYYPPFSRFVFRCLAGAVCAALILVFAPRVGSAQNTHTAAIDSMVQAELHARPIAGMVVGVVQGEDTLFLKAYGKADLENGSPMSEDGVFRIASLTKQFTAAAVLELVEQGRVALDDDIRTYLPDLDTQGRVLRIRQLLNHTSGVRNVYELAAWSRIRPLRLPRAETRKLVLQGLAEEGLDFEPGTDFHYSNTGYDLLGDMIEKVTGTDLGSFFRTELLEPLGMDHTSMCPWPRVIPHRVRGYEPDGGTLTNAFRISQGVLFASGGLCSDARDLLRWNAALHGGRVLSPESYRAMTTPEGASTTYGYGLFINTLQGHRVIRHNGSVPGFASQLEYYPDDSLSIVVLANSPAMVGMLASDIALNVLGLPPRRPAVRPDGWKVVALQPGADTTAINFRTMMAGVHVTAGPGALYFNPDSAAVGDYTVAGTFIGLADPDPDYGHGILLAGRSLETSEAAYLRFVVRGSGEYALIRHAHGSDEALIPWTEAAAIHHKRPHANAANALAAQVERGTLHLQINDEEVAALPLGSVGPSDGIIGLWVGDGDDVHIDGFGARGGRD